MAIRVLIVDDEKLIVKGIRFSLEQDGMEVDTAYDGQEAVDKAREGDFDIILLDVMLPVLTGFEALQQIREFSTVPVMMLTAKGEDMDKILGLEYGADDYITKPFNILEVKARIKAIVRRTRQKEKPQPVRENTIISGDMVIEQDNRRVTIAGKEIRLTAKEFDVLELLATHPGQVYSREKLLAMVWGADYPGDERTVDVHIRRLREKVEQNSGEPRYVHTKWGMGYYFKE
ncbi:MAG: response regulator transcription factor [Lachnospiraceae bacterium]|nr:response regulator transcription factor [Lachnospiraceae bacterium]